MPSSFVFRPSSPRAEEAAVQGVQRRAGCRVERIIPHVGRAQQLLFALSISGGDAHERRRPVPEGDGAYAGYFQADPCNDGLNCLERCLSDESSKVRACLVVCVADKLPLLAVQADADAVAFRGGVLLH